jgi:hypothetical protein
MSKGDLVRFSRGGDQFHYLWAAHRCLSLLTPASDLVAITIEGVSPREITLEDEVEEGIELIDVTEYYGSETIKESTLVRYIQLKHSTQHPTDPWPPSGLEKTLRGFADRYKRFSEIFPEPISNLEFCFISNRPIDPKLVQTVEDAARQDTSRHPDVLKKLEKFTGLCESSLFSFCKLLRLEGNCNGYWDQRNLLVQDTTRYLPDADVDAPVRLKELVTRKALPESIENPTIRKGDLLRALNSSEDCLFPAPCCIENINNAVPREQEADLIKQIINADGIPVIIHASSGVGKSVFATRIKLNLPEGSECIIYDCFGNGQYRNTSAYRHRHKDSLVQIVNELASKCLCHPLIPTSKADCTDYTRAFLHRIRQSISSLRVKHSDAILCIIVDAADNAQIAAEEIGETRSFAQDLLREQMPHGVRLVMLCRTHRQELLDPPSRALRLELKSFTRVETEKHLRNYFPEATELDVDEFHRLSSQNPRVQSMALCKKASSLSLSEILRALGPNPTTVDDAIANLLENAVGNLLDQVGSIEKNNINLICMGLAILRPLIPIPILALISGVDESAITSFAVDLGRPLIVNNNTIQFFDEPAETWFRDRFNPKANALNKFIESLKPLASSSSYVSSALPQLMLGAGQFRELIEMALSSTGLPDKNPLDRRDVELQRLQFALKASLRAELYIDAAKLALKTGGVAAGNERTEILLQENTDLVSKFLSTNSIQEIVSRKMFGSGWIGSHHVYEAGLMSWRSELLPDARSRLRMANEWLKNWSNLPSTERKNEKISDEDIAEMAIAHYNIHGVLNCAKFLRSWIPRAVSFRAGRILARRFVDHDRYPDLDLLVNAAKYDLPLILAITLELREVHRNPPQNVLTHALSLLLKPCIKLKEPNTMHDDKTTLRAITALVEAGYILSTHRGDELAGILKKYLPKSPPRTLSSPFTRQTRFSLMRAYALQAALAGHRLKLLDLAFPEVRNELEDNKRHYDSQEAREFKQFIGALLPWHQLWVDVFLGNIPHRDLSDAITATISESSKAAKEFYGHESSISNEIAILWLDILVLLEDIASTHIEKFSKWIASLEHPLFSPISTHLSRIAARTNSIKAQSLQYARDAFDLMQNTKTDAEEMARTYVDLARATLSISKPESEEYFNQAIKVTSRIGDENLYRWDAILNLADKAANPLQSRPKTAYKLSRCAELTYDYVYRDKHFDWESTVKAIAGLCPSSSWAILSRWRDRNFGQADRLLPTVINYLIERNNIDPKAALALTGFRANWDKVSLLRSTLNICASKNDKETVSAFIFHYMRLEKQNASTWQNMKELTTSHNLIFPDIDELIAFSELENQLHNSGITDHITNQLATSDPKHEYDWDIVFSDIDLSSANGLAQAYSLFQKSDPPIGCGVAHFFKEACDRVNIGNESEFIRALSINTATFDLHDFRCLFEHIPETWETSLAVKSALRDTIRSLSRSYCMSISRNRHYQTFPFGMACELSGIRENELANVALSAIGETTETLSNERLFSLVGLLASQLSSEEALEALSFGLALFEDSLDDTDGDGPWSEKLIPPTEIEDSIAGYIWAGLAAPRTSLRWEFTHVVRGLCILGLNTILDKLISLATKKTGGAFVDANLNFYHLHARQWLLIGLSRASIENPEILAPYRDFFLHFALSDEPHVLIRGFAAKALLALAESNKIQLEQCIIDQLQNINNSKLPVVLCSLYERHRKQVDPVQRESGSKRFSFGYDTSKYCFTSLGDCFALSSSDIEKEAELIICDEWGLSENGHWGNDERHKRDLFKDGESLHSHGFSPQVDDLNFYLSYHAMMTVAGNLLATIPLHQDQDDPEDEFNSWLRSHSLLQKDGHWLADRRDPLPLDLPIFDDSSQCKNWCTSIRKKYFEQLLSLNNCRLNLWGSWRAVSGNREESVHISSALVSSNRSSALLRALQTVLHPHDYRIPSANDDLQINHSSFQLKGWISDPVYDYGLDRFDPWAGNINYPPITPALFVLDLMQLSSDSENRVWQMNVGGKEEDAIWSQIWGCYREKDDPRANESGRRLQTSLVFVMEFLRKSHMDLIVEVEINRSMRQSRYGGSINDEIKHIQPKARLFIIKKDGSIHAL